MEAERTLGRRRRAKGRVQDAARGLYAARMVACDVARPHSGWAGPTAPAPREGDLPAEGGVPPRPPHLPQARPPGRRHGWGGAAPGPACAPPRCSCAAAPRPAARPGAPPAGPRKGSA